MNKEYKNLKPTTYNLQPNDGFTLMETLIAATVLILAVTGTLSIISRNVSSAAIAKERVTAFYLAQEAIEYVRGVRDNNAIANPRRPWLDGMDGALGSPDCFASDGCIIDVNATPEDQVGGCSGDCPKLLLNTETGVYGYGGGIETVFTREVKLDEVTTDREVRISATVKWMQGSVDREFTLSGTIFNWR